MTTNVAQTDLILFAVGPVHCAADSGPVDAVLAAGRLSHLPGERDSAGVLRHGGRLVTVVDLRQRFGLEPAEGVGQRILVVETPAGPIGYRVDRVDNVVSRGDGRFGPTPRYVPRQVFPGTFTREGRIHLYADLARLRELPAAGWLQAAGLLPEPPAAQDEPPPATASPVSAAVPDMPPRTGHKEPAEGGLAPVRSPTADQRQAGVTAAPDRPATTAQPPVAPAARRPLVQRHVETAARTPGRSEALAASTRASPPSWPRNVRPTSAARTGPVSDRSKERTVQRAGAGGVSPRSPIGDGLRTGATEPAAGGSTLLPAPEEGAWRGGLLLVAGLCLLLALGFWLLLSGGASPRGPDPVVSEPAAIRPVVPMAPATTPVESVSTVPAAPPVEAVNAGPEPASEPSPPTSETPPAALPTLQREGRRVTLILDEVPSRPSVAPSGEVEPELSPLLVQDVMGDAEAASSVPEAAEQTMETVVPERADPADDAPPVDSVAGVTESAAGDTAAAQAPRLHEGRVIRREILHVVRRGDTLWAIAARYLDDPYRYPELARLSDIRNPDLIYPGDEVRILILGAASGE